ncbi:hypothetical protein WN943_020271 [Citrus x changshan-huyou]
MKDQHRSNSNGAENEHGLTRLQMDPILDSPQMEGAGVSRYTTLTTALAQNLSTYLNSSAILIPSSSFVPLFIFSLRASQQVTCLQRRQGKARQTLISEVGAAIASADRDYVGLSGTRVGCGEAQLPARRAG